MSDKAGRSRSACRSFAVPMNTKPATRSLSASFSAAVTQALGLAANERIAGFIYIGTDSAPQDDRERPVMADIVTRWQP